MRSFSFRIHEFVPGSANLYKGLFLATILDTLATEDPTAFAHITNIYDHIYENYHDMLDYIWEKFSLISYDKIFFGDENLSLSVSISKPKDLTDINIVVDENTRFLKKYFICEKDTEKSLDRTITALSDNKPLNRLLSTMATLVICKTKCFNPNSLGVFKISLAIESINFNKVKYSVQSIEDNIMDESIDEEEEVDAKGKLEKLIKETKETLDE